VSVGEKLAVDPVTGLKGGYTMYWHPGRRWQGSSTSSIARSAAYRGVEKGADLHSTLIMSRQARPVPIDGTKRRAIGGGEPAATLAGRCLIFPTDASFDLALTIRPSHRVSWRSDQPQTQQASASRRYLPALPAQQVNDPEASAHPRIMLK